MRRSLTMCAAGLAAVLAVGSTGAAGATTPAQVTGPTRVVAEAPTPASVAVDAVTLSRSTVAASGFNTVPVTVRAHVRWAGVAEKDIPSLVAVLTRRGPAPSRTDYPTDRDVTMRRVSGTALDGVYEGTFAASSTMNGTFVVSEFASLDWEGNRTAPRVSTSGPRLTVRGTHLPALVGVTGSPTPVRPTGTVRMVGRVVDTTTGKPFTWKVPVHVGTDSDCVEPVNLDVVRVNPRTGAFSAPGEVGALNCVYLRPTKRDDVPFWEDRLDRVVFSPTMFVGVTARPTAAVVRTGRTTAVTGVLRPLAYPSQAEATVVELQRRYPSGRWHTVGKGEVSNTGTFRLVAQPPRRGRHLYRVMLPAQDSWARATSRPFTLTAR